MKNVKICITGFKSPHTTPTPPFPLPKKHILLRYSVITIVGIYCFLDLG